MERAQQAEKENVIHRCRVEAMQCEMDLPKNTAEELRKERYCPTTTEGLSYTSPQWLDILNRVESIERENQQLKGES